MTRPGPSPCAMSRGSNGKRCREPATVSIPTQQGTERLCESCAAKLAEIVAYATATRRLRVHDWRQQPSGAA